MAIVCPSDAAPDTVVAEGGFRLLKIQGLLDFSLTGILLAVAGSLADIGISIFVISTFDTDYILVKKNDLKKPFPCCKRPVIAYDSLFCHTAHMNRFLSNIIKTSMGKKLLTFLLNCYIFIHRHEI